MHEFFQSMTGLYEEIRHLPMGSLRGVAKMRGRLRKLFRAKADR